MGNGISWEIECVDVVADGLVTGVVAGVRLVRRPEMKDITLRDLLVVGDVASMVVLVSVLAMVVSMDGSGMPNSTEVTDVGRGIGR